VIPDPALLKKAAAALKPEDGAEGTIVGKNSSEPPKLVPAVSNNNNNVPLLTDAQIEEAIAKKDKEIAKRKIEFEIKEAELLDIINK